MKLFHLTFALILFAASARGNLYIPNAKLAGETVHVRLMKNAAVVTAVFEFEEFLTRDAKIVYFPIFSENAHNPVEVLANSEFELAVGDKKQAIATPCPPPEGLGNIPNRPRVFWFSANIDDLTDDTVIFPLVIKVTYTQPRIQGRFHYLPIIPGAAGESTKRSWNYQMLAYSGSRVTQVTSKPSDYEQLADSVVVYLKDRQPVELQ